METYRFEAVFIEVSETGGLKNAFTVLIKVTECDHDTAVVKGLFKAQKILRALKGCYFFRLQVADGEEFTVLVMDDKN